MRFVSPETVRIDLGPNEWIEIKKELNADEQDTFRTASYGRVVQGDNGKDEMQVNWKAMFQARVLTYLVDWSLKVPCEKSAILNLAPEDFKRVDEAIRAYLAKDAEEKKQNAGGTPQTVPSAS